jgi:hypothetical protein
VSVELEKGIVSIARLGRQSVYKWPGHGNAWTGGCGQPSQGRHVLLRVLTLFAAAGVAPSSTGHVEDAHTGATRCVIASSRSLGCITMNTQDQPL